MPERTFAMKSDAMAALIPFLLLIFIPFAIASAQIDSLAPDRFAVRVRPNGVRYLVGIDLDNAGEGRLVVMGGADTLQTLPLDDHPQTCHRPVHCFDAIDIDFDGYLDLMMRGSTTIHDQAFQFWRHDPRRGRFVPDDTISGEEGEPVISRRRRELTFQHVSVTGDYQSWTTYRLIRGRFTLVERLEMERLDGAYAMQTVIRVHNGRERVVSRKRVLERL